jgi:hypothetical protein
MTATNRSLPEKIVAIDETLVEIPHAFGGALALAYYAEPRATVDIDLNVFIPAAEARRLVAPLQRIGAALDNAVLSRATRDGQIQTTWDRTPLDIFLSYDPFHDAAKLATRTVPFTNTTIPILAAEHLVVCKAVFDRAKDWVDIDAIREAGTRIDSAEVIRWVQRIVGDDDPRFERIVRALTA